MKDTIFLDKYKFLWKEKNDNVIVAEIRHYVKNEHGGILETPIGNLICFKEDRPVFWRVKILLREDIKFNQTQNQIFILAKSACQWKLNYYIEKIKI
jgi:hypothetical protein